MQNAEPIAGPAVRRPARSRMRRGKALALRGELGIEGVAALKEQLRLVFDEPAKVVLDTAEVTRLHSAALQLFCLFCRDRRAEGREVEMARPSAAMLSAASLLGASALLQLAQAAS